MPDRNRLAALLVVLLLTPVAAAQTLRSPVMTDDEAAEHGLTRAWVTQLQVAGARSRVHDLELQGGTLFALSDYGALQAIDAETGTTLWYVNVGRPGAPNSGVCASEKFVALCSGGDLYVLDRKDGGELFHYKVRGVPTSIPAIGDKWVYVPTLNGQIEAFSTTKAKEPPLMIRGFGAVEAQPMLTNDLVVWGTVRGFVYGAERNTLQGRFRFATRGAIEGAVNATGNTLVAGSADGFLYAIDARKGGRLWQVSLASPVRQQPVAIGASVYAVADEVGMYCLTVDHGLDRWFVPDITQFVAASATRMYVSDRVGRLVVLDAQSGARVDTLPTGNYPEKLTNVQTDRIYLGTPEGLLVCLRESQQVKPLAHFIPPPAPAEKAPAKTAPKATPSEAPAIEPAADDGFADPPADGATEPPAGEAKEMPADKQAEDPDNPFG